MASTIKTVGVVGTGVIGASWTALFLGRGLRVLVSDPAPEAEKHLMEFLKTAWPSVEALGLAPHASISNCRFVGKDLYEHCGEVDYIQENAPEKVELKRQIIAALDKASRKDIIIASSSSGLPSSKFVTDCEHPERVLIGHPFNPPHLMPLVEVVPHPGTGDHQIQQALDFYRSMGKTPVLIKKETPGFVANRLQAAVNMECYSLVHRGIISAEDLDIAMTTGVGLRWAFTGPYMTNVLGGGGGAGGFRHLLTHLGPGMVGWKRDMDENAFVLSEDSIAELDKKVQEYLGKVDMKKIEHQRDEVLIDTIKRKGKATALV